MPSASAKALDTPPIEVASGSFRVASSTVKIQTSAREELHNLTQTVREFVQSSGIRSGMVNVSSLHTTCAVLINEWQDALVHDVTTYLRDELIAKDSYYRHNDPKWSDCDRHNADSHLRSLMLGMNMTLQIADGEVVLGRYQSIIMTELDGPQERTVRLQAMGVGTE